MADIERLLKGYKEFYQKYFIEAPETYQKLFHEGQKAKTLVIACSDSRADPSIILNCAPGEIFVIRNVANLVPPYEEDRTFCHGTSAAIEYAVKHLEVENIIVMGHSDCGGIKTLIEDRQNDDSFISPWMNIIRRAENITRQYSPAPCFNYELCEKEAIRVSVENLMTFPFVKERVTNRKLAVYGWYFCLKQGIIEHIATVS